MIANPPTLGVLVNAALLVVLLGFLMIVGKPVLLPILAAVIAVLCACHCLRGAWPIAGDQAVSGGVAAAFGAVDLCGSDPCAVGICTDAALCDPDGGPGFG